MPLRPLSVSRFSATEMSADDFRRRLLHQRGCAGLDAERA